MINRPIAICSLVVVAVMVLQQQPTVLSSQNPLASPNAEDRFLSEDIAIYQARLQWNFALVRQGLLNECERLAKSSNANPNLIEGLKQTLVRLNQNGTDVILGKLTAAFNSPDSFCQLQDLRDLIIKSQNLQKELAGLRQSMLADQRLDMPKAGASPDESVRVTLEDAMDDLHRVKARLARAQLLLKRNDLTPADVLELGALTKATSQVLDDRRSTINKSKKMDPLLSQLSDSIARLSKRTTSLGMPLKGEDGRAIVNMEILKELGGLLDQIGKRLDAIDVAGFDFLERVPALLHEMEIGQERQTARLKLILEQRMNGILDPLKPNPGRTH